MKPSFDNSVAILVKAYLNDTLDKCDYAKCAVGNLVAGYNNFQFTDKCNTWQDRDGNKVIPKWDRVVWNMWESNTPTDGQGWAQIHSTGYTASQIKQVEDVFMDSHLVGDDPIKGLMAVVEVLAHIHNIPQDQVLEAKELFVRA